jgi:hypothetical protein
LKSPPIHQGIYHQEARPASSSQSNLLKESRLGPYTPAKAQVKSSATLLKEQATTNSPTYTSNFSTTLLSHMIRIPPEAPHEGKLPVKEGKLPVRYLGVPLISKKLTAAHCTLLIE